MGVRLSGLLDVGLGLRPDGLALVAPGREWSWRGLEVASGRYAQHLLAVGVRRGDRVASLMPEGDALVVHYLACFRAGLVATPLNFRYTPPEIDHALRVSGARLLLVDAGRLDDVAASRLAGRLPLGLVVHGGGDDGVRFEDLLEEPAVSVPLEVGGPAEAAAIFFTSGSTGPAKGVTHSVRSLEAVVALWGEAYEFGPGDVVGMFASLSHIGGFGDLFSGLSRGAKAVIPERHDVECQLRLIRTHRPTYGVFMSSNLFSLVRDDRTEVGDFSSFRVLGAAGDKVPAALQAELSALGGPLLNEAYGMTEIGNATLSPLDVEPTAGSVGRPAAGYEMEIRDKAGSPVPLGTSGRLWVRSKAVMSGYWNEPEGTSAVLVGGWFDTGDVFTQDEDGYLWFQGREKQIIVHNGSNISPQEVEDALVQHPAVLQAGVVGVPDTVHGENVRAFIELKPGATTPDAEELIAFARTRVGYKAPKDIIIVDALPLSPSGKIDRTELKRISGRIPADFVSRFTKSGRAVIFGLLI